jgi:DNA-binding MarR family transcriptional regulator
MFEDPMTTRTTDEEGPPLADKEATIAAIADALADLQAAYDDRDQALAQYLGVGRTDLRCLDLIIRGGPQTASDLGARLHLTRGSMTTLIDRLERAGYVRRRDDPSHGRRKLIIPTPRLANAITPVIRARQAEGTRELRRLPTADLPVILRFLQTTLAGQDAVRQAYLSLATFPNPAHPAQPHEQCSPRSAHPMTEKPSG